MKLVIFLFVVSFSSFAYDFKPGVYEGLKMGPFHFFKDSDVCSVEILNSFDEGLIVKHKGRVEFLKKNLSETDDDYYSFDSLNLMRPTFSWEKIPSMTIFSYTDGPAFSYAAESYDCVELKLKK